MLSAIQWPSLLRSLRGLEGNTVIDIGETLKTAVDALEVVREVVEASDNAEMVSSPTPSPALPPTGLPGDQSLGDNLLAPDEAEDAGEYVTPLQPDLVEVVAQLDTDATLPLLPQTTGSSIATHDIGAPLLTDLESSENRDLNRAVFASLADLPLPWGLQKSSIVSIDCEGGFEVPADGSGAGRETISEASLTNFYGDIHRWRITPSAGHQYADFRPEFSGLTNENFADTRVPRGSVDVVRSMIKFACRGKVIVVFGSMKDVEWLEISSEDSIVVWDFTNSPTLKELCGRDPTESAPSLSSMMYHFAGTFMQQGPRQRYRVGSDDYSAWILPNGYPAPASASCVFGHSSALDVECHLYVFRILVFNIRFEEIPLQVRVDLGLDATLPPPRLNLHPTLPVGSKAKLGDCHAAPPAHHHVLILGFNNPSGRSVYAANFFRHYVDNHGQLDSASAIAANDTAVIVYLEDPGEAASLQQTISSPTVETELVSSRWLVSRGQQTGGRAFLFDPLGRLVAGTDEDRKLMGACFADMREEMFRRGGGQREQPAIVEPNYLPDQFIDPKDINTTAPPSLNTFILSANPAPHLYPPPSLRSPSYAGDTVNSDNYRGGRGLWLQWCDSADADVATFSTRALSYAIPSRLSRSIFSLISGLDIVVNNVTNGNTALASTGGVGPLLTATYPSVENFNSFPFSKVMLPHGMSWATYAPTIGRSWHGGRVSARFRGVRRRITWTAVLHDTGLTRPTLELLHNIRDGLVHHSLNEAEMAFLPGAIEIIEKHLSDHPTHAEV